MINGLRGPKKVQPWWGKVGLLRSVLHSDAQNSQQLSAKAIPKWEEEPNLEKAAGLHSVEEVICIVQRCRKKRDFENARYVYWHVCNNGLEHHKYVGNYIVPMFVDCGNMAHAQQAFSRLIHQNEHSWTSLISGYAGCGHPNYALSLYHRMRESTAHPSKYTHRALLKACATLKDLDRGRQIHLEISQLALESDIAISSTLIDMYAKCGSLSEAQQVFDRLPIRNVVSWTALIAGYVDHGACQIALELFEQMQIEGVSPNTLTYLYGLKACSSIGAIDTVRKMHVGIAEKGFDRDFFVGSTLVDIYAKYGSMTEALEVFRKLPARDVVLWNGLLAGHVEHGSSHEVLDCLEQMRLEDVPWNAITYVCGLKACSNLQDINKGQEMHLEIIKKGFDTDLFVSSALVDMYAKCGLLSEARAVFDKVTVRDVVSWTALIAGYAEYGPAQEALKCFDQMQLEGISLDVVTYVCALKACGRVGAIDKGRELHAEIMQMGLESDLSVSNTLVDFYSKCGLLSEARQNFDKLLVRTAASWDTMINGYGMNHESYLAIQCFEDMQEQGMKPTPVTFICLLNACSHASLVSKGCEYFKVMRGEYGIIPTIDHCTCMVDILGRSGHLHRAEKFLETMACPPSVEAWTALLSACKTFGEIELGMRCFEHLVQINPEYSVSYVLMASICTNSGRSHDALRIEELRKSAGAKKKAARASIEVNKVVYEFMVGRSQCKEISAMLELLSSRMKSEGNMANVDQVLKHISDDKKDVALCVHAEKLALAFGLLNTPQGQTLHVTKNMRMCNNCHNANKIISRVERREIIVRDGYCVHHFKDGLCSCATVF